MCNEVKGNTIAFTVPFNNGLLKNYVDSISQQFNLINVQTTTQAKTSNFAFDFNPSPDLVCDAFADLLKFYQWRHAIVFYNSETSNQYFQ